MLQRIRDNASGPLAYAVVGLISLVFGVWGIGSYFTPSANPVVASVGDIKISRYQLQQTYNARYQRLREVMGDRFDTKTFDPQTLRRSILQQLIQSAVLDQYALNAGYRATDQALLRTLTSNPDFQVNGKFSTQRYKALLANAGLSPAAYETRLRRQIVSAQARAGIVASAFVAPPALDHAYSLLKQERKLDYLIFPASAYRDQVQLDDKTIKAWYEKHQDQYMRPERVKLAYVELARSALEPTDALTEQALRTLYDENKARFSTPDRRDGREIFVPVTADNAAQARASIQAIAQQLNDGKSFDDIAADGNADVRVSSLDNVTRSALPADIANALFSIDVGEVSTPVRGADGWYLVKATAANSGTQEPFASSDVQDQLKAMALKQWRNKRFGEMAERMETLAFQAPNSLDTLASELGLKIQQTGWITRAQGEGLGQSKVVRQAAFSDAVLGENLNSTAIQTDNNHRVVVRIAAHEMPQQRPLQDVRQQVKEHLIAGKAQELAHKAAQAAKQELATGSATLQQVAARTPAQFKSAGYIDRATRDVPLSVREAAFGLPIPANNETEYTVTPAGNNGVALVALNDVKTDVLGADESIPQRFMQGERAYIAQLEFAAFAEYLNKHADVELNEEQVEAP